MGLDALGALSGLHSPTSQKVRHAGAYQCWVAHKHELLSYFTQTRALAVADSW